MDGYWKAVAAALIAAVLCLVVSKQSKDIAILLTLLTGALILSAAMGYFSSVLKFFHTLEDLVGLEGDHFQILLKVVGIGMVGEMSAMVCADAGNATLGKGIQILGTVLILCLSLPLFQGLLDLIQRILEGI